MATALILTFTAITADPDGHMRVVGVSSQSLTFVDVKPAVRALEEVIKEHELLGNIIVTGVILKDVVI